MATSTIFPVSGSIDIRIDLSDIKLINIKCGLSITEDIKIQINIKPYQKNKEINGQIAIGWLLPHNKTKQINPETNMRCALSVKNGQILRHSTHGLAEMTDRIQSCVLQERKIRAYSRQSYPNHEKYLDLVFTVHVWNGKSNYHAPIHGIIHGIEPDYHAQYLHVSPLYRIQLAQSKVIWACNPYLFEYIMDKTTILMSLECIKYY